MGKIIKLNSKLANMIAAGEVVEQISNVIKELVENALDAQSTSISVLLEESGLKKIQVVDNGTGMDLDDAMLAFERHATSKIKSEYDLFHINSLGFRGEALPSIASISHVELITSMGDSTGSKVIYLDGEFKESGLASARKGTSITVSRLFYNTPARFKYLKSPQTELSNIQDIMNKFGLSHPGVSFSLSNNAKMLFQTTGSGDVLEVIAKIYGLEVAKSMQEIKGKNRDYEISCYISNPIQNRASKSYISIIVNNRMIKNFRIINQIIEAYDQLIPKHRYPICLVNINVDPMLIDVNIHPSKQEIKFSEESQLLELILNTIKKKLLQVEIIQDVKGNAEVTFEQSKLSFHDQVPFFEEIKIFETIQIEIPLSFETRDTSKENELIKTIPDMDYIGQYRGTYLLFQNDSGLYLLDQHAAAERIRYERYIELFSHPNQLSYQLIVPMILNLSNDQVPRLKEHINELSDFGIVLTQNDSFSYHIISIPSWFPRGYEVMYTEEVVYKLLDNKKLSITSVRDELAKLLACKHSLKANAYITENEVHHLLDDLRKCKNPFTCPHGRPIVVSIHNYEIEKWFKRIMS